LISFDNRPTVHTQGTVLSFLLVLQLHWCALKTFNKYYLLTYKAGTSVSARSTLSALINGRPD